MLKIQYLIYSMIDIKCYNYNYNYNYNFNIIYRNVSEFYYDIPLLRSSKVFIG